MKTEIFEIDDVHIEMLMVNQANTKDGQPNTNDDVVQEWEVCIRGYESTQRSERKQQIEQVPSLLLKGPKGKKNREYYMPAVVSLGPYHHKRDNLAAAEKYKFITLEEYCLSSKKPMDHLYNKVFEVTHYARNCYIDGSTDEYNDEEFNRMMLRDGCFIVFFIESFASGNRKLLLNNEYLGALGFANVTRDIFLLENQIPFAVLQVLLDMRFPADGGKEILNMFFNYLNYGEITTREENVLVKKQPLHLLELYRSYFIPISTSYGSIKPCVLRKGTEKINHRYVDEDWNNVKSFASVMELKAKGIFVKCTYDQTSKEYIKFHSRCCYGELELVRRAVYLNSKAIYLNMIAYEMCPHNPNDFRVSSYIRVMRSLVINCDDVKELRNNNILLHSLGQDEEVVKLYHDIITPAGYSYRYNHLRQGIEQHCNSKYKTWVAELINVYFSGPWKTVALLAATAILLTSFLQTYFTIRPLSDDYSDGHGRSKV